jgi:2-keto-4-pentenoate hydratase/2-oxohepta-3-ene-1,7-dioic acid hydratase in catechol pathway
MKMIRFYEKNRHDQASVPKQGVLTGSLIKEISGDIFKDWDYTGKVYSENEVSLTVPLEVGHVIGIGKNYVGTEEELSTVQVPKLPVFFFKPNSSVIESNVPIVIPGDLDEVKFESELAVVIGKEARNIKESDVDDVIFGFTIGNDVTAPQYFHEDGHWTLGKSFDTFTPLGPAIVTDLNPDDLIVKAIHNGVEKQNSSTQLMIVPIRTMVAYLSQIMTLKPGDVILTGSPVGADFIKEGDTISCEIRGIGKLSNQVVHATNPSITSRAR